MDRKTQRNKTEDLTNYSHALINVGIKTILPSYTSYVTPRQHSPAVFSYIQVYIYTGTLLFVSYI